MLTGLDLYKLWDNYKPFEEFQVLCINTLEHYQRPFDNTSVIKYEKGQRYTCYRVGSSEITFKKGDVVNGSNDKMMWDCFIRYFDIPELTREDKINTILR